MNDREKEIAIKVDNLLRALERNGERIWINDYFGLHVSVVCSGTDTIMGYHCELPPNHNGRCWDRNKNVNFQKENE